MKTTTGMKLVARMKTLKYLVRHPIDGTRNLLALRGARSLARTRGAAVTAAVAATAVAVPLAVRAVRGTDEG